MRHVSTALAAAIGTTMLLTACTHTTETTPPSASPTSQATTQPAATTTATATSAATPTPPPMPDAARAHTEAGAKAFVEYFWDVVNYAQATGDTTPVAELTDPGCTSCKAGIARIRRTYRAGGLIKDGQARVRDADAVTYIVGSDLVARVTARVEFTASSEVQADGRTARTAPAGMVTDEFRLTTSADEGSWRVAGFTAAPR